MITSAGSKFSTCPDCKYLLYWDYNTDEWRHVLTDLPIGQCSAPEESISFNEGQAESDDAEIADD